MQPVYGVYVLSNPMLQGIVKIGMTLRHVDDRLKELYSSGVPEPFKCEVFIHCASPQKLERDLHRAFESNRGNTGREFFKVSPETVQTKAIQILGRQDHTVVVSVKPELTHSATTGAFVSGGNVKPSPEFERTPYGTRSITTGAFVSGIKPVTVKPSSEFTRTPLGQDILSRDIKPEGIKTGSTTEYHFTNSKETPVLSRDIPKIEPKAKTWIQRLCGW